MWTLHCNTSVGACCSLQGKENGHMSDADGMERFKMLWKRAGMRGIANGGRDDCNKSAGIGYDWARELEWLLNVATKGACRVQRGRAREQSKARVSGATRESAGTK